MGDRLVLLGTKGGPAIRPGGPLPTSTLLEIGGRRIVIDCGLGVTRGLVNSGLPLKKLDLILITHLHSDHVVELGPLLHTAWTSGLNRTVTVFGPTGIEDYWTGFLQSMRYDIDLRIDDEGRPDLRQLVDLKTYSEGTVHRDNDIQISTLRVDHPPVTECFALKIEASNRSVVFSADTTFFPPLGDFAKNVDVLVHEAMLPEGVDRLVAGTGNGARLKQHLLASHTMVADAARIARDAGARHLVLHHLIPADARSSARRTGTKR
jgi:ribonuclease BN (tRNA processing enzyme)